MGSSRKSRRFLVPESICGAMDPSFADKPRKWLSMCTFITIFGRKRGLFLPNVLKAEENHHQYVEQCNGYRSELSFMRVQFLHIRPRKS
jgi:hypothetical protein